VGICAQLQRETRHRVGGAQEHRHDAGAERFHYLATVFRYAITDENTQRLNPSR
jgi:hypothetical protein